jgi:hypothetical protein
VKTPQITLSEAAVADILEQAEWYEAQALRRHGEVNSRVAVK